MAATDVNARWQAEMAGFFVADGPPDRVVPPDLPRDRFDIDLMEMNRNA